MLVSVDTCFAARSLIITAFVKPKFDSNTKVLHIVLWNQLSAEKKNGGELLTYALFQIYL